MFLKFTASNGLNSFKMNEPDKTSPIVLPVFKKTEKYTATSAKVVLENLNKMANPLLAVHTSPDPDAIGSAVALALVLKSQGKNPTIYIPNRRDRPEKNLIEYFRTIVEKENINIVNDSDEDFDVKNYDGLITLDTGDLKLLEPTIRNNLSKFRLVVDIDHHQGSAGLLMSKQINTSKFLSTTGLLLDVFNGNNIAITQNIAMALLGGIVSDTNNFSIAHSALAKEQAAGLLPYVKGWDFNKIENVISEYSDADVKLAEKVEQRIVMDELYVPGLERSYKIAKLVVRENDLLPGLNNWRDKVNKDIERKYQPDIALVVYYDTSKNFSRGSLRRFNNANNLDFIPIAEDISGGRGHPGAVGFDFRWMDKDYKDYEKKYDEDGEILEFIIKKIKKLVKLEEKNKIK